MSKGRKAPQRKQSKGRLYFAISDVSSLLSVSPSTLRMWENMGLITPDRTSGGRRMYSPEKVERLKYIQNLRTEKKLNVEAIREMLGTAAQLNGGSARDSANRISISRHLRKLRRQHGMTLS